MLTFTESKIVDSVEFTMKGNKQTPSWGVNFAASLGVFSISGLQFSS